MSKLKIIEALGLARENIRNHGPCVAFTPSKAQLAPKLNAECTLHHTVKRQAQTLFRGSDLEGTAVVPD
jgi:hypothetical protein